MMKYAINHWWKFKFYRCAVFAGFLQFIAMFGIALANYLVITISDNVLDVAKDFTALLIIADFDDIFANTNGSTQARDIVTGDCYERCFVIEVTTSHDAKADNEHNKPPKDLVYELMIKDDIAKMGKEETLQKYAEYPRKRPESIRINFSDRAFENQVYYLVYRAFRVFHVTIWFYFFPFLALLATYYFPLVA
jgi:hypothetical protein